MHGDPRDPRPSNPTQAPSAREGAFYMPHARRRAVFELEGAQRPAPPPPVEGCEDETGTPRPNDGPAEPVEPMAQALQTALGALLPSFARAVAKRVAALGESPPPREPLLSRAALTTADVLYRTGKGLKAFVLAYENASCSEGPSEPVVFRQVAIQFEPPTEGADPLPPDPYGAQSPVQQR